MYGVAGEKATGRIKIGRFFTNFADPTIARMVRTIGYPNYVYRLPEDLLHTIGSFLNHADARHMYVTCTTFRNYWSDEGLRLHSWVQKNKWCSGMICNYRSISRILEPINTDRAYDRNILYMSSDAMLFSSVSCVFVLLHMSLSLSCLPVLLIASVYRTRRIRRLLDVVVVMVSYFDRYPCRYLQSYICTCVPMRYTWESIWIYASRAKPCTSSYTDLDYELDMTNLINHISQPTRLIHIGMSVCHTIYVLVLCYISCSRLNMYISRMYIV
jgi:hypothetical protein